MAIEIRPALEADAFGIQALLVQLGYERPTEDIQAMLAALKDSACDQVRIACDNEAIFGLIALHWAPMLQARKPVARIATLVVHDAARGRGVGRLLVDAGAALARQAGCEILELTTGLHRSEAQSFYRAIGFTASATRFHRML